MGFGLFSLCFFFGGGGGAGIQRNATLTQSIALRNAIVGRENLIAGGLLVLLFCLFVCCLFCCCFLVLIFFGGQGLGLGLFCLFLFFLFFFFWGGGGNTTQRDVNAIHRTSECYSWQRKFDRRWFVCCCFLFVFFFVFILFLLFFRGRGLVELFWGWWTGYRLSQLCSEHCITENFSAISFSVCFAFCCGLVCLVFFFFLNPCSTSEHQKI